MGIPFTQYMRPDGRKEQRQSVDLDEAVEKKALSLIAQGFRFEMEVLTTGEVSMTIVHDDYEHDLAIRISPNGPGVLTTISSMITEFDPMRMDF